jgi:hypothetical protein
MSDLLTNDKASSLAQTCNMFSAFARLPYETPDHFFQAYPVVDSKTSKAVINLELMQPRKVFLNLNISSITSVGPNCQGFLYFKSLTHLLYAALCEVDAIFLWGLFLSYFSYQPLVTSNQAQVIESRSCSNHFLQKDSFMMST